MLFLYCTTSTSELLFPAIPYYVFSTALDAPEAEKVLFGFGLLPHIHCLRRDDTIFLRRKEIFLGYCFKHVTGEFVAPWVDRRKTAPLIFYSRGTSGVRVPVPRHVARSAMALYYACLRGAQGKNVRVRLHRRSLSRALAEAWKPAFLPASIAAGDAARAGGYLGCADDAAGRPVLGRAQRCGANGVGS